MANKIVEKFKNWVTVSDQYEMEENEYLEEEVEEYQEDYVQPSTMYKNPNNGNKVVSLHTQTAMKVMIVEPKKYDEVTQIADHLKQKKTVIVNLENLADANIRRCIFEFMSGAVYVLEGDMQKVSKGIFILAPHNVNIDASLKKELESKTFFPWNSK